VADETLEATAEPEAPDLLRQPMLDLLQAELGADLLQADLKLGDDLCIRVHRAAWRRTVELCRDRLGLTYFCFLSGIDWQPNPQLLGEKEWEPPEEAAQIEAAGAAEVAKVDEARAELEAGEDEAEATGAEVAVVDAEVPEPPADTAKAADTADAADTAAPTERAAYRTGVAGGDSRFQVFARLYNVTTHVGLTLKADLDADEPSIDSLVPLYRGADWHEREAWEMYGFNFVGHPGLRHLYLPGEFEGYPLRKDFPLLARLVKPWPGLVDVEPMPGEDADPDAEGDPTAALTDEG
jgi:NADH-quinone oxidoreductase subunit C